MRIVLFNSWFCEAHAVDALNIYVFLFCAVGVLFMPSNYSHTHVTSTQALSVKHMFLALPSVCVFVLTKFPRCDHDPDFNHIFTSFNSDTRIATPFIYLVFVITLSLTPPSFLTCRAGRFSSQNDIFMAANTSLCQYL